MSGVLKHACSTLFATSGSFSSSSFQCYISNWDQARKGNGNLKINVPRPESSTFTHMVSRISFNKYCITGPCSVLTIDRGHCPGLSPVNLSQPARLKFGDAPFWIPQTCSTLLRSPQDHCLRSELRLVPNSTCSILSVVTFPPFLGYPKFSIIGYYDFYPARCLSMSPSPPIRQGTFVPARTGCWRSTYFAAALVHHHPIELTPTAAVSRIGRQNTTNPAFNAAYARNLPRCGDDVIPVCFMAVTTDKMPRNFFR